MAKQNKPRKINVRDLPAAPGGVTLSEMLDYVVQRRKARRLESDWSSVIRYAVEISFVHERAREARESGQESKS